MEVVEIVIFMSIAVMVGALILTFLVDWDVKDTYDDIRGLVIADEGVGYMKVDSEEFIIQLYNIWDECGFGEVNMSIALFITKTSVEEIDKEYLFSELKKLNWCSSLNSEEYNCGYGEDLIFDEVLTLPTVATVRCMDNNTLAIE